MESSLSSSDESQTPTPSVESQTPNPRYFVCVTHNNILGDTINLYTNGVFGYKINYKISNCEIIKFVFIDGKISEIVSVYKNKELKDTNLLLLELFNPTGQKLVFFAIRHAEGEHNSHPILAKFSSDYTDPSLTEKGKGQAKCAGSNLKKYIDTLNTLNPLEIIKIERFFVSTLVRTRETLAYVLEGMEFEPRIVDVIVLPGSEEVSKSALTGYENTSNCTNSLDRRTDCKQMNYGAYTLNVKWEYWDRIYNRGSNNTQKNNMFQTAFAIIDEELSRTRGGKRQKKAMKKRYIIRKTMKRKLRLPKKGFTGRSAKRRP